MPLNRSCSLDALRENIAAEIAAGKSRDQAVAVAHSTLRDSCSGEGKPIPTAKELGGVVREFKRKGGPSREYLEEALKQAREKLPHRDYAILHHAARSRAGGRISARQRATSIEKSLALGPGALYDHELDDALSRAREMLAADLRLERAASIAQLVLPGLELEHARRLAKAEPGADDVHVDMALGRGKNKKPKVHQMPPDNTTATSKADRSDDPGVMIAVRLPENTAAAIAMSFADGGEPPSRLHCTLAYLGRMSVVGTEGLLLASDAIRCATSAVPILRGCLSGIGRFSGGPSSDGKDVIYASVDVPGLTDLRHRLVQELACRGLVLAGDHDYTPHVTLAYVPAAALTPKLDGTIRLRDVYFDAVVLSVNDADTAFALGELPPLPMAPDPEAYAMSVAKGAALELPAVHAEVVEDPQVGLVAKCDELLVVAFELDAAARYQPGDMVAVRGGEVVPSSAVEATSSEVATVVAKSVHRALTRGRTIDFEGPDGARVVFVAAAPTELEDARGQAMVGADGVVFAERYLGPLCLTKSQVALGFAVPFLPEPPEAGPGLDPPESPVDPAQVVRWTWWLDKSLARWPAAKVVAIGKAAKLALGDRAHLALPHPSVVRRFDSGEVSRKLRAFAKTLDAGSRLSDNIRVVAEIPSTRDVAKSVAEAIGGQRAAGQVPVRISKAAEEMQIVYGVVLDPYQVDTQGDWIPPAEIESTAHGFLTKSRVIGVEHRRKADAVLVESWVMPYPSGGDYQLAKQNLPHKVYEMPYGNDKIHSGAWIAGVKLGAAEWADYKRGELGAFSVGGFSFKTRVPTAAMPKVEYIKLAPLL